MIHPRSCNVKLNFYPRSPCGERHANLRRHRGDNNFYPRSPCGERLPMAAFCQTLSSISIHALLAESDWIDGLRA